jgi:hypothetical protein
LPHRSRQRVKGEHDLVVGNVLGGNLFIALGGGLPQVWSGEEPLQQLRSSNRVRNAIWRGCALSSKKSSQVSRVP